MTKTAAENAASVKEVPEIVRLRKEIEGYESALDLDDVASAGERVERYCAGLLGQVRELLWQAECGLLPLTADRLQAVLDGKPVTHLI